MTVEKEDIKLALGNVDGIDMARQIITNLVARRKEIVAECDEVTKRMQKLTEEGHDIARKLARARAHLLAGFGDSEELDAMKARDEYMQQQREAARKTLAQQS